MKKLRNYDNLAQDKKTGRFVKYRFDRYCFDCNKKLSGYKSKRCGNCASKLRAKKIMCSHNKPHTLKSRLKNSVSKGGNGKDFYNRNDRIKYAYEHRVWREKIFKRDNWICQHCGQRGGQLEAHHIKRWIDFPKLRFIITNGLTLCKKCHYKTRKN